MAKAPGHDIRTAFYVTVSFFGIPQACGNGPAKGWFFCYEKSHGFFLLSDYFVLCGFLFFQHLSALEETRHASLRPLCFPVRLPAAGVLPHSPLARIFYQLS
jgi:hypothetical protein